MGEFDPNAAAGFPPGFKNAGTDMMYAAEKLAEWFVAQPDKPEKAVFAVGEAPLGSPALPGPYREFIERGLKESGVEVWYGPLNMLALYMSGLIACEENA